MIRGLAALALLWLTAAAPPAGVEALSLSPGQALILTVGDSGEVSIVGIESGVVLTEFDKAAARAIATGSAAANGSNPPPPGTILPPVALGAGLPPAPPLAKRRIRIALAEHDGGKARLLLIENGYGRGFRYRAAIHRDGRSGPTDVCAVLPRLRGYEHWPYTFSRIDLTDLRLVPMREGEAPICE